MILKLIKIRSKMVSDIFKVIGDNYLVLIILTDNGTKSNLVTGLSLIGYGCLGFGFFFGGGDLFRAAPVVFGGSKARG